MGAIDIIAIGAAELPRVRDLAWRIWPECYADILPPERIGPMLDDIYALETLQADVGERGHLYWLATVDGADAGFASAYREADRVWLKKLYILAGHRSLGLGKRLMDAALAAFPGAASLGLYVNEGNTSAIDWYRSRGFAIEDHVPVQMGPFTMTDYVMGRALPR